MKKTLEKNVFYVLVQRNIRGNNKNKQEYAPQKIFFILFSLFLQDAEI